MTKPVPSDTEEGRIFEFRLACVFSAIRQLALADKMSPDDVRANFEIGAMVETLAPFLHKRGEYPIDMTMEDALSKVGQYAKENGISPLEVIRRFEFGGGVIENSAHTRRLFQGVESICFNGIPVTS
jgi:hypothetical protein